MLNDSCRRVVIVILSAIAASMTGCGRNPLTPPTQGLAVASVLPNVGLTDSATPIRIFGSGFQPGVTVTLGGSAASVSLSGSSVINAMAPAQPEGPVDVVVTNPGGQSARLAGGFSYARMVVVSVTPGNGIIGKWLRITGSGFLAAASVTFDGVNATVIGGGNGSLLALAPNHDPGPVDVVLTNPSGSSATLPGGFTYQAVTVTASQAVVTVGSQLTVNWVAPPGQSTEDWVGLFKPGETLERWFVYTGGLTAGTQTLTVAVEPGEYEFRYLPDDQYNVSARSSRVTVVSTGAVTPRR